MKTKPQTATARSIKVRWTEKTWCPKISRKPIAFIVPDAIPSAAKNMKQISTRASLRGFTLIELLVVIAIIAILAGLLLPTFGKVKTKTQIAASRNSIQGIVAAISQYYDDYSRYPTGTNAPTGLDPVQCPDFTYGTVYNTSGTQVPVKGNAPDPIGTDRTGSFLPLTGYQFSNAEIMAILLDQEYYRVLPFEPPSPPAPYPTYNVNHQRNPRKKSYLDAKMVDDPLLAGVGPDLVYRDPWGSPYIITLDLNYDGKCRDSLYRRKDVSWSGLSAAGYNGLYNTIDSSPTYGNNFEYSGGVMVWSIGPDKKFDKDSVADPRAAQKNVNTDNIISW